MCWLGVTSRLDSQLHTERLTGFSGDDLLARTAVSTIVEVAGWDPSLIHTLSDLPPEVQPGLSCPRKRLSIFADRFSGARRSLLSHDRGSRCGRRVPPRLPGSCKSVIARPESADPGQRDAEGQLTRTGGGFRNEQERIAWRPSLSRGTGIGR